MTRVTGVRRGRIRLPDASGLAQGPLRRSACRRGGHAPTSPRPFEDSQTPRCRGASFLRHDLGLGRCRPPGLREQEVPGGEACEEVTGASRPTSLRLVPKAATGQRGGLSLGPRRGACQPPVTNGFRSGEKLMNGARIWGKRLCSPRDPKGPSGSRQERQGHPSAAWSRGVGARPGR